MPHIVDDRYDALGRRVTTRSRSTASCIGKPECNSYPERTAWDGDQVLMENRASGRQGATSAKLNSDNTTGLAVDDYLLRRVRYTHAGGIDAPVTVPMERLGRRSVRRRTGSMHGVAERTVVGESTTNEVQYESSPLH